VKPGAKDARVTAMANLIETPRLLLRPFERDDAVAAHAWFGDSVVMSGIVPPAIATMIIGRPLRCGESRTGNWPGMRPSNARSASPDAERSPGRAATAARESPARAAVAAPMLARCHPGLLPSVRSPG